MTIGIDEPVPDGWVQDASGNWGPPPSDGSVPPGYKSYNGKLYPDGSMPGTNGPQVGPDGRLTTPLNVTGNVQGPTAESQAQVALNNHFQYGGKYGEADKDADYYRKIGEDAQNRPGAQINTDRAHGLANQAQGNAAAEGRVADLMWKRATGQTPSIAGMRADQDMRSLSAAQSSAAASARGPAALALAQQEAAANTANGQSTISNLAQINSAQERSDAEKAAYGAYSGMRGQDFQGQALEQDVAAKQAALDEARMSDNDKLQMGMTGAEIDVNKAQLGAQGNQIGIATGAAQAQAARDQAAGFHDDDRLDKYIGIGAGVAGTVGGVVLASALGGGTGNGSGNGAPVGSTPDGRGFGAPGAPEGDAPQWLDDAMGASGSDGGNPADPTAGRAPMPTGGGPTPASMNRFGASTTTAPATIASLSAQPQPPPTTIKPAPAPTLANIAPVAPPNSAAPKPAAPPTLASTTYKPPNPATITSDENQKYGFSEEGNYSPAGGMSRDTRAPTSRVDAFLDGIHPLSYNYKDPAQEPRSSPTGGRYLGVSAQDMERTPTGKQLVSDGPRGKQLETGPSLSAALAGVARLHERVKDLESQQTGDAASLAAGPSVGGPKPMTAHERALVEQARAMQEGDRANLAAGPSVRRVADGTPETGYRTTLTDGAEQSFARDRQALYGNDSGNDYDLRGAYAAGESRAGNGHMTDRFKMPNHETFSDESQYAADRPDIAGHWEGERYTPKGPPGWLRQEMEAPMPESRLAEPPTLAALMQRRGPHKRFDDGYAFDSGDALENLGPSGSGNQDRPDYNFIKSGSPLDVAAALETDRNAIRPSTEDYMRREGLWDGRTDALLRDRGLDRVDTITSDMRAKDDVVDEGEDRGVVAVSNGRFQPPAAPRRAATPVARADAGPQRRENAASEHAYDTGNAAALTAVPLGYGGTLGAFHASLAEDTRQRERRAAMRPVPAPVTRSMPAPTLANVDSYEAPTAEELARYGASPAEIAAAMRMNGGGR